MDEPIKTFVQSNFLCQKCSKRDVSRVVSFENEFQQINALCGIIEEAVSSGIVSKAMARAFCKFDTNDGRAMFFGARIKRLLIRSTIQVSEK